MVKTHTTTVVDPNIVRENTYQPVNHYMQTTVADMNFVKRYRGLYWFEKV